MQFPTLQHPEELPKRFVSGWNNRNVDELVSIFTHDAEFVNVVGLWWHNKAEIRQAHDYGLRQIFQHSVLKLQKTTVKNLTDDVAVVHAKMILRNQTGTESVSQPALRQTVFSFVAQRFESGWNCVSAHNTDIEPGADTHIINEEGIMKSVSYRSKKS